MLLRETPGWRPASIRVLFLLRIGCQMVDIWMKFEILFKHIHIKQVLTLLSWYWLDETHHLAVFGLHFIRGHSTVVMSATAGANAKHRSGRKTLPNGNPQRGVMMLTLPRYAQGKQQPSVWFNPFHCYSGFNAFLPLPYNLWIQH